ncbi:hypothetical protein L1887_05433 [Cichorium endivia]|nr:hypothetical protein L1887_05433 [Cichorium endivia]
MLSANKIKHHLEPESLTTIVVTYLSPCTTHRLDDIKITNTDETHKVFNRMLVTGQYSWNSMVSRFAQCDRFNESVEFFVCMHSQDFILNQYSYGNALGSCAGGFEEYKIGPLGRVTFFHDSIALLGTLQ